MFSNVGRHCPCHVIFCTILRSLRLKLGLQTLYSLHKMIIDCPRQHMINPRSGVVRVTQAYARCKVCDCRYLQKINFRVLTAYKSRWLCLQGVESISDYAITFHYVSVEQLYNLDFYVYHLRPYGIVSGLQELNRQQDDEPPTRRPAAEPVTPSSSRTPLRAQRDNIEIELYEIKQN